MATNPWTAEIARINALIIKTQQNIARDQALLAANPASPDAARWRQQIASGEEYLIELRAQLAIFQTEYNNFGQGSRDSAGEIVAQAAQARDDGATATTPSQPVSLVTSDGRIDARNLETGTDAPVRTITETQSIPPPTANLSPTEIDNLDPAQNNTQAPTPSLSAGTGAGGPSEDSGAATKNSTRAEIDNVFNQDQIVPSANVLDQYASYSWLASLYLMKPEEYQAMVRSGKKSIPGSQLLIQSGGAPVGGRNTYFSNDYYIDKVTLKSAILGKGTRAAHNVSTVTMTVVEPNGITFINNLDKAVQAYLGSAGEKKKNWGSAIYLLVIRFYGYDDAGNLIRGGTTASTGGSSQGGAFIEKYYPICISNVKFKVANKIVEYEIEAAAINNTIATSSNRGTIPYNVELGGITVKDALVGPTVVTNTVTANQTRQAGTTTQTPDRSEQGQQPDLVGESYAVPVAAPPKANAALNPKITVKQGLMTALNQYQQELVKRGVYTYPDTYSVEFVNSSLEQASIQVKNPDKNRGSMPAPTTASEAKNPATQAYDPTSRIISVTAGYQIVQFIDQVLRNSTYLTDQALVRIGENGKQTPNGTAGKNVAGYKISVQATPTKYDPKRNDYAYDIKYILSVYQLQNLLTNYFQVPKYKGAHKQYNYWFTGENNQVLSYEQTYNAMYTSVLSGGPSNSGSVINNAIKANFFPASSESNQGAAGRTNEIGANFADYLYNPGDLANATLKIVGDPAWLQQGEAFATPGKNSFSFRPFLTDGTINFEASQVLFEILINTPGDYDLSTGLIDPNIRQTVFQNNRQPGVTRQSYIYQATECVSEFNKGSFTQTLKGTLLAYLPDQTFKEQQSNGRAPTVPAPVASARNPISTASGTQQENEWVDQTGLNVLKEDLPSDETEEDVPISLNDPTPAPPPEPVTSDGDIATYDAGLSDNSTPDAVAVSPNSQLMDRET